MNGDYYAILWIDEKAMDELMLCNPAADEDFPKYAALVKNTGAIRFWPKIDPTQYVLMAKKGVV